MRKPRVAVITSRRKATNARKSETIAAMKSTVMSLDRLTGKKVPVKRVAIVTQMSRAQMVPNMIARFTKRARVERRSSSSNARVLCASSVESSLPSRNLARSTMRPSRFARMLSNVATPVIRNTGAIASWITWAMAETRLSGGMAPISYPFHGSATGIAYSRG